MKSKHVTSLKDLFKASQVSAIVNVETALKSYDARIHYLEQDLAIDKACVVALKSKLSAQKQKAKSKHDHLTVELASQKLNLGLAKLELSKAKEELEEANQQATGLQNNLGAMKQQNVGLQAELELAKRQPADLQDRLKAVEQRHADLEAHLKAATQRASTAEDELKAFKSRFNQINDDMNALASSSAQQPTVSQLMSSSAPPPTGQGSTEETRDALQEYDHRTRTQSLEPHVSHPENDKKFDSSQCESILNEFMDEETWVNRYFLSPGRPATRELLVCQDAKLGPMNLGIMKNKLARGGYTSDTSFKADFNSMIADCKRLNPPKSLVYTAAEQLARTFEQTWSAHHNPSHKSRNHISQDQESRNHKRKASTEGPVSSKGGHNAKKAREDSRVNDDTVQPASSDADNGYPANPAMHRAMQSADKSQSPSGVTEPVWQGHLTTGPSINVNVAINVKAKAVSVGKYANTLNDWKSLLPRDLRVAAYTQTWDAETELFRTNFYALQDTITLRLEPASETDSSAFKKLFKHLISKERYATITHQWRGKVNKIYLIPALPKTNHSRDIRSLGHKVLPQAQTQEVMFMVMVYHAESDDQKLSRQTWNDIMKAVHSPDLTDLEGIHDHLVQHPLPIYRPTSMAVFSVKRYFDSMISDIPLSPGFADTGLFGEYRRSVLNLSYKLSKSDDANIDGVELPESVFILGRVVALWRTVHELLVVDIQNKDRPLWVIPSRGEDDSRLGTTIGLLTRKFPKSWDEWEKHIVENLRDVQSRKQLKDTGLQIKRLGSTHESAMEAKSI